MVRIIIGLMASALMAGLVFWIGDGAGPGSVSAFVDSEGNCFFQSPEDDAHPFFGYVLVDQEIDIFVVDEHCVVEPGKLVEGSFSVTGTGQLTVDGTVEGNNEADTTGNITVSGTVEGNIEQSGDGHRVRENPEALSRTLLEGFHEPLAQSRPGVDLQPLFVVARISVK